MQINKAGTALYAMQKALEQPQQLVDAMQKSVQPEQKLAAAPKPAKEDTDIAAMTGKGLKINTVV